MASTEPISFDKFFNVIDGKLTSTETTRCSQNPSTLKNNPDVPLSTIEDVEKAVQAAKKAAESWAQVPWEDRKKAVEGFASALEAQLDDFAALLTREQGKPVWYFVIPS